jgi:hypothetical protein
MDSDIQPAYETIDASEKEERETQVCMAFNYVQCPKDHPKKSCQEGEGSKPIEIMQANTRSSST